LGADASEFDFDFDFAENQSGGDGFLLLSPRLDNQTLGNALSVYTRGNTVYLPLTAIATLLELGIQLSSKAGIASGFIITQDRPFFLNAGKHEVVYGNQRAQFREDQVLVKSDDIYVDAELLSHWLPVDFEVSTFTSVLTLKPREKTPLQQRLERERRMQMLGGGYADPNYPRLANTYKLFDGPLINQTFSGFMSDSPKTAPVFDGAYSTYLSADLLYLETDAYFTGNSQDRLADYRLTAGRHDYYGRLLGPLEAREFLLGDLFQPTQPLVSTSRRLRGATVSNIPLGRPNESHGETLRGNLAPGWTVELYQDGFLTDYRRSDITGLYDFENVPLHVGNNELKLVFYGPYGERREATYTYNLAELLVPPGEVNYRVTAGEDEFEHPAGALELEAGVTDFFSLNGGYASMQVYGERLGFASFGLRAVAGPIFGQATLIQSSSSARAFEAGAQTRVSTVDLSATLRHLEAGYTSALYPTAGNHLKNQFDLGAHTLLAPDSALPIDVRVDGRRGDYYDLRSDLQLRNRLSTAVRDTSISNFVSWHNGTGLPSAYTDGQLTLSRSVAAAGDTRVTGDFLYLLHPIAKPTGAGAHVQAGLPYALVAQAGFTRYFQGPSITDAGLARDFGVVALSLAGHYTHPRVTSVILQANLSAGYVDAQKTFYLESQPFGSSGSVLVKAFLDTNHNGIWDTGEKAVQKAEVVVNGTSAKVFTGRDGMAFVHSLPPYLPANVNLAPGSFEDPSWLSTRTGVSIVPRPGRVSVLEFPILPTGVIEGNVYLNRRGEAQELPGARVELWSAAGKRIQVTTTEFDGYFAFEKLPAGDYQLGVADDDVSRLEGAPVAKVPISLTIDAMQAGGQRLVIKLRTP
jgi:hypothetical protein